MFSCREAQAVAGFQGFAGFGDAAPARPTFDYVKAGDVVSISLSISQLGYTDPGGLHTSLLTYAPASLIAFDGSALGAFSSMLSANVNVLINMQSLMDRAHLNDILADVMSLAQASGLTVNGDGSRISFVTKVEATGGTVPNTVTPPAGLNADGTAKPPPPATDWGAAVDTAVKNLTASPTTLLMIAGLGIVGLIVLTKK